MKNTISAVVLTKNEEKNIGRCLSSLVCCDEVVVIDDYSQDKTIERIKNLKIYKKKLNNNFAAQRNFGLKKAKGNWVLFIDADEKVPKELTNEIKRILKQDSDFHQDRVHDDKNNTQGNGVKGYYVRRKDYFMGRWLKYGETASVKLLRLAKKGTGKWKGKVHEEWEVKGEIGQLKTPLLHYPHPTIAKFLQKINHYTDIVAQCWKEESREIAVWEIFVFPVGKFIRNYIFRQGFRDGMPGLIMAVFMTFHSFLVRGKYWTLK